MSVRILGASAARWFQKSTPAKAFLGSSSGGTGGGIPTIGVWSSILAISSSSSLLLAFSSEDNPASSKPASIESKRSFDPLRFPFLPSFAAVLPTTIATACDNAPAATENAAINSSNQESSHLQKQQREKFLNSVHLKRKMTNVGRFSLVSETAQNPSVVVLVVAMNGQPYRANDFTRLYKERKIIEKYPRFNARLNDQKTHFVFGNDDENDKSDPVREVLFPTIPRAELKDRINDAALYEPLDLGKTLWEAWTATGGAIGQSGVVSPKSKQNNPGVESLLVFRAHHCLADGVSLGALFTDLMDEGPQLQKDIQLQIELYKKQKKSTPWWKKLLLALYYWIWGGCKALLYQVYLMGASWYDQLVRDNPWAVLKQLYDQEHTTTDSVPPRTLSWASMAPVDEVKAVADFYTKLYKKQTGRRSKMTVNDVFCSCVSAAIVKQLQYHRAVHPKLFSSSENSPTLELPYINLIMPVHLQGGILLPGQSMGNKIGAMVSRIPGDRPSKTHAHNADPGLSAQDRLMTVHSVLNDRKQTPAAVISYLMAGFLGYFSSASSETTPSPTSSSVGSSPSSWTPWLFQKAHANASVVVTNVRGPPSKLHLEGRSVERIMGFLPLPGGVPLGVVVSSYDREIHLTLTAEEYAVPDPDLFLQWVKDEYEILKQRADNASAGGN